MNGPLASNDLLRATVYPDATDSGDRVTSAYNRQGERTAMTDQNDTRHRYDYDRLGRLTADRVVELGLNIDETVRRIETSFNVRGQVATVTSYDAPTAGSPKNQVSREYNPFDQLTAERQSHAGVVVGGTPQVQYAYADGSSNTTRPTTLTYPNGRVVTFHYGPSGGDDERLSRVASIDDSGSARRVAYTYLGLSDFIKADYPEPQVKWDLSPTGNSLSGWDALDRTVDCLWRDYGGAVDVDRIQYGYDRNGNRTWRKNSVAPSGGNDELYTYDGVQRLIDMSRGDLTDDETAVDDATFAQSWQLDATGNWNGLRQTDVTTPTNNLDQQRTSNRANEITGISRRFGRNWTTPVYDRAGNTTNFPQLNDPTQEFSATYDAWNRLMTVTKQGESEPTATYRYDGLNRRITANDGTTVRHTYFTAQWQWLEERIDGSSNAERQAIWGLRYIDDLILRDRDTDGNGSLDERLYALQDANWNMTAVVNPSGDPQERYRYSAYGVVTFLNPDFTPTSPNESSFDWETLYCGYRHDPRACSYLARNRIVLPSLGLWATPDPIGTGSVVYVYAQTNPLSLSDPLGLEPLVSMVPAPGFPLPQMSGGPQPTSLPQYSNFPPTGPARQIPGMLPEPQRPLGPTTPPGTREPPSMGRYREPMQGTVIIGPRFNFLKYENGRWRETGRTFLEHFNQCFDPYGPPNVLPPAPRPVPYSRSR